MVTAGHCVRGPKPIEWVRAGGHLVEDEFKGQTPKYGTQLPPYQQQRITEEDIIVHEGYGQKGNNIVDDIALIRLPERVQRNKGTQFACMPSPNNASYADLEVITYISLRLKYISCPGLEQWQHRSQCHSCGLGLLLL